MVGIWFQNPVLALKYNIMKGIEFIPSGPLSDETKARLKRSWDKRNERLRQMGEDAKNSIIENGPNGILKLISPKFGTIILE